MAKKKEKSVEKIAEAQNLKQPGFSNVEPGSPQAKVYVRKEVAPQQIAK